ncbi:MAG: AI-2E family transporter [Rickettsiales bacterium]|jgi:predicted PurR-regulated permease PerM|nr:AI-2E family transporter [Rickettsiales bacterium]
MKILEIMGEKKNIFSIALALAMAYFFFKIRSALSPFIFGFLIAYSCKRLVSKFEKKFSRGVIAIFLISVFFLAIFFLLVFLIPIAYQQALEIVRQCATFVEEFNVYYFYDDFSYIFKKFNINNAEELKSYINGLYLALVSYAGNLTNSILNSSIYLINAAFKVFLTPIITYYFIVDWNGIVRYFFRLIPTEYRRNVINLTKKIDVIMCRYIAGQLLVTAIISAIYTVLLKIIGFDYAVMLGMTAGFLTLLPYVGSIGGFALAFLLIFFKHGFDASRIISVSCVFSLGQFLEGNFITPNILGKKIKVHPLWIIFSLLAGGCLYGFWGMIFSLPFAAIVGVILRYNRDHKNRRPRRIGRTENE